MLNLSDIHYIDSEKIDMLKKEFRNGEHNRSGDVVQLVNHTEIDKQLPYIVCIYLHVLYIV